MGRITVGEAEILTVTAPVAIGVIVKFCGTALLVKVNGMVLFIPPPAIVTVSVPVKMPSGVTVKFVDA